jgi:hypothetical protein
MTNELPQVINTKTKKAQIIGVIIWAFEVGLWTMNPEHRKLDPQTSDYFHPD